MSKALLAEAQEFTPSPLQRAAIGRIRELCHELAGYGLYPRTSMELEFFVQTDSGAHIPGIIRLEKAAGFIRQDNITTFDKFEIEGEPRRRGEIHKATQYEVTLDDRDALRPVLAGSRPSFNPLRVAQQVEKLKTGTLPRMLRTTTCMNPVAGLGALGHLLPNFTARPYASPETSGLHVNISLTDRDGRNIFAQSPPLLFHCADGVAHAQHATLLASLPAENAMRRLGANPSAPAGIGILHGSPISYVTHNSVQINGLQFREDLLNPIGTDAARIENRLPGADADPFVAMAVTLAGVVQAVRKHMHITRIPGENRLRAKIDPAERAANNRRDIPREHDKIHGSFTASSEARELLGPELYKAVLAEYGPQVQR